MNLKIIKATLPENMNGFTVCENENDYSIVINDSLEKDLQAAAFLHECLHIWNEDFFKKKTVLVSENQTTEQLKRIAKIILEKMND